MLLELLEDRRLLSAAPVFTVTNLVSDLPGVAKAQDADLVNPWGIAFAPKGPFWVSDNGTAKSTLYDGTGAKQKLVVTIPGANGQPAAPTGQVFNDTGAFNVAANGKAMSPVFIFASEDGTISGWNPKLDPTHAVLSVNHSATSVFKGIAIGQIKGESLLYVANFRTGNVDVFGPDMAQVHLPGNAFHDDRVPKGFAPFNVADIGGHLYVTYATQNAAKHDDVAGPGNGYIDEFDTRGHLVRRLQHGAWLSSPWGMTVAPSSFGSLAGDLLFGNFGNGTIDAYDPGTGKFAGTLKGTNGQPIQEDGLWAITPGSGSATASTDTLYFTAGLNDEADGLFGSIQIKA